MSPTAVIFDLFGTLVDNFSVIEHQRVLARMARAVGASPEAFVRLWVGCFTERSTGVYASVEAAIEAVCGELGVATTAAGRAEAVRRKLDFTRQCLTPRPGALEALRWLRAKGFRLGLITDCSAEVPLLWPRSDFSPLIEAPIFSCVVRLKKPEGKIYALACEQLQVEPAGCLYVGDGSSRELTGAAAAGMHPVQILAPHEDAHDTYRIEAEQWSGQVIASLSEVRRLVTSTGLNPDQP